MALDLSETLVIGVASTALFDLSEANTEFQRAHAKDPEKAVTIYRQYMLERESHPIADGTAMPLIKALLELNRYKREEEAPLVEVVVMSRNSPETGVRILNTIRSTQLPITRHAFTGGESVVEYLDAFDVDLFLTTNVEDAQQVIDGGKCPAAIIKDPPDNPQQLPNGEVRIAFDGDAVLFDESSEIRYKEGGLRDFHNHENTNRDVPMGKGPYASFLEKLSKLQRRLPCREGSSPVRLAIVTARDAPAELRVINTLRSWNVYVDAIFFLGGVEKAKVLKAFRAHIYFDDQDRHLDATSKFVPAGKVPHRSGSPLAATPPTMSDKDVPVADLVCL